MSIGFAHIIGFLEEFYNSRTVLLQKFPHSVNADGSIQLRFSEDPNCTLTYKDNAIQFCYENEGVSWTTNINADEILIRHVYNESTYEDRIEYFSTISIVNGNVEEATCNRELDSGFGEYVHNSSYGISPDDQETLVKDLVAVIRASHPLIDVAMKEYKAEYNQSAHRFFVPLKTDLSPSETNIKHMQSISDGVEDLIKSYIG
jgi:hypothetical protein